MSASLPLITIVMPTRNQAQFIESAICSVLDQDYANLELVVADGASTDSTSSILTRISEQDGRLRWFSKRDSGPAQALNYAIAKARGTLIGWLNSDDLYTPGAISRAVNVLHKSPELLMVYGQGEHIDESGKVLETYPTLPPDTPIFKFKEGCFICQPTVFIRRSLVLLNGKFDESLQCAFDFDYWLRAFAKFQSRIGFVDELQARSRLHERGITSAQRWQVMHEGIKVLGQQLEWAPKEWVLTYLEELVAGKAATKPGLDTHASVLALLEGARPFLLAEDAQALQITIANDTRLNRAG